MTWMFLRPRVGREFVVLVVSCPLFIVILITGMYISIDQLGARWMYRSDNLVIVLSSIEYFVLMI